MARSYRHDRRPRAALALYERLLRESGGRASLWCEAGTVLAGLGEHARAAEAFERCLALSADHAEARHELARCLYRLGAVDRARLLLEAAIARQDGLDAWLALATLIPGCPGAGPARILEVRRAFAERLARAVRPSGGPRGRRRRSTGSRLRVGYLSADFGQAAYMRPVWGLINQHDREAVEIHLLVDEPTARMEGYREQPRDQVHLTAALELGELAERIRSWELDVVVDLGGYRSPRRLALFLHPMAGVTTVGWFNHYATSGLPGLQHLVGDHEVHRRAEADGFCERVARLPVCCLTFEPPAAAPPPAADPPCRRSDVFTLGSLASLYKLTAPVLDAWSAILRRASCARLLLANADLGSERNRSYLSEQFAQRGIGADRLELRGPAEHADFLRRYEDIDLALDAFPYSGGTTTMEALWQGVPVLTWGGDRWAARTTRSLSCAAGLQAFVAADVAGYVDQAARLAGDPATPGRLARLRRGLRQRLRASSACDTRALARHMERLYRALHGRAVRA